jgi:hypothetical protein
VNGGCPTARTFSSQAAMVRHFSALPMSCALMNVLGALFAL